MPGASNVVREDKGCEFYPKCSDYPEPTCIFEVPYGALRHRKKRRAKVILNLTSQGKKPEEVARLLGLSERTIGRVLAKEAEARASPAGDLH